MRFKAYLLELHSILMLLTIISVATTYFLSNIGVSSLDGWQSYDNVKKHIIASFFVCILCCISLVLSWNRNSLKDNFIVFWAGFLCGISLLIRQYIDYSLFYGVCMAGVGLYKKI
jgi:hypothetical protein